MTEIRYEAFINEDTHLHIQNGNNKTGKGIYTVNLLPGDKPLKLSNGTVLTNIAGTCGGCCKNCKKDCYAVKYCKFHYNTCIPAYNDNTILARYSVDTFFTELQQFIDRNIVAVIRYHASGEIPSYEYLQHMRQIAIDNPDVKFYTYTKRYEWIEQNIKEDGMFPSNLVVNVSIWNNNYENPYNLPEFIYDDRNETKLPHCPAYDNKGRETGITCASCKICFKAKCGSKIAVYAH